jgi:hypothetical protein
MESETGFCQLAGFVTLVFVEGGNRAWESGVTVTLMWRFFEGAGRHFHWLE